MARLVLTLTAETELISDAVADVDRIFRALAKFHGDAFRELECRIDRLVDVEEPMSPPTAHWIGQGHVVFEPPSEIKAIIRDARALGVI